MLGPWELIPLVSAAMLGMRCRWCRARIPVAHVAVELACLAIAAWAVLIAPDTLSVWLDCVLGWTLLTLAWIDWEHMLLPDALTLPLILAGLGATLLAAIPRPQPNMPPPPLPGTWRIPRDRDRLSPAARARRTWPGGCQIDGGRGRLARADATADGGLHGRRVRTWRSPRACGSQVRSCIAAPPFRSGLALCRDLGHLAWLRSHPFADRTDCREVAASRTARPRRAASACWR